jgi:hypothetical protein
MSKSKSLSRAAAAAVRPSSTTVVVKPLARRPFSRKLAIRVSS